MTIKYGLRSSALQCDTVIRFLGRMGHQQGRKPPSILPCFLFVPHDLEPCMTKGNRDLALLCCDTCGLHLN